MYQGFFINLDRSEERRRALTRHLEEMGAASRYRRIEAVDGRAVAHQHQTNLDPGSLGCWLSHLKTLEASIGARAHLHIIEDDMIFAQNAARMFDGLLKFADAELSGWDLIFTDICVVPMDGRACTDLSRTMKEYRRTKTVRFLDLQYIYFAATSSYFVNWQSLDKLTKLISRPGMDGLPIDAYLRNLVNQKVLKAYVTVPFLTSVSDSLHSDIRGELDRTHAVFNTFRRAFFQDADLQSLDAKMQELIKGIAVSPLELIYAKALLFTLSDQYVDF